MISITPISVFQEDRNLKGGKKGTRDARIFEYSSDHKNQDWIKYSLSAQEEWHKFTTEKRKSRGPLTFPTEPSYSELLPLSPARVDDIKKVVYKYVPREFRQFYDDIIAASLPDSDSSQEDLDTSS